MSQDRDRVGAGVKLQFDCHQAADALGWTVAEDYMDDDISAYSRKSGSAYERMLTAIEAGGRHAVIVNHTNRLTRRPIELKQFADVCSAAGVTD